MIFLDGFLVILVPGSGDQRGAHFLVQQSFQSCRIAFHSANPPLVKETSRKM